MNWAQLTNRPNNGSQRYNNNNNNNSNNNNNYQQSQNKSNNNRRTINNLNYPNKYRGYQNRNNNNNNSRNNNNNNQYYLTQHNNNNNNRNNPRNVGITSNKKRHSDVNYVILDAGAFIGRQSFFNNFNPNTVYYMTPAVQNEIRDKQSRQFLERFPYEIKVRKPDQESVQFVNTYLQKNPNLKNLSKVDRQIIALAHTLEREHHGNGNLSQSKYSKAMTVIGGATGKDKDKKKPVKKSKTGRIHTEAKPLNDTGVRLAMFKKVIPFHFDDFMTLSQDQYGDKYGKPTPNELMSLGQSPLRAKQANKMEDELKENKMNLDEKKENGAEANKENEELKSTEKKVEKKENQVKYNPNIKAMTEIAAKDANKDENETPSPMSKSRRRKERKKRANLAKQDKIAEKSALTEENMLAFQLQEDKEDTDDDDGDIMKEITMEDISKLKQDIEQQKLKENEETKSNAESEKSEIEKMIEEDLTTTFNETASLISSLSEQSTKQFKQASQMQYRLGAPINAPRISQSQSLPANPDTDSIAFGTLFQGTTGSLFPSAVVQQTGKLTASALSNSPLPPIDQDHASNPMPQSYQQQSVPQPHPEVHTQAQPRQAQGQQQQEQIRPQSIRPSPQQKITINEAWQGDWLGADNYKPIPKNEGKKKKAKLKNVQDSSNDDSSVALITVDLTMQRAMIGMGLRVLTTSSDRQYGNNNRNGKKGGRYNNGEPVDWKFRCFSCYNIENDTTRITCRVCGNQTFQRVSIYQDENGRYHDRYSYVDRYTTRYKKGIVPYASGTRKINAQNSAHHTQQGGGNNKRNNNKKKNKYNQRKNNQSIGGGGGRYRGGWRQM